MPLAADIVLPSYVILVIIHLRNYVMQSHTCKFFRNRQKNRQKSNLPSNFLSSALGSIWAEWPIHISSFTAVSKETPRPRGNRCGQSFVLEASTSQKPFNKALSKLSVLPIVLRGLTCQFCLPQPLLLSRRPVVTDYLIPSSSSFK